MNNLRQVIPNKKITCDNTPCSKSLCQEATGEASKLCDMLFSQEESIPSFSKVTQKCWKLQQGPAARERREQLEIPQQGGAFQP